MLKYHNVWGTSPTDFSTAGDTSPRNPTAFGAHADAFMGLLATFTVLLTRILRKLGHSPRPAGGGGKGPPVVFRK